MQTQEARGVNSIQFTTALQPGAPDDGDAGRQQRGLAIAALSKIERVNKGYRVPSQSSRRGVYYVDKDLDTPFCDCPDFELRRQPCKHFYAALVTVQREQGEDVVVAQDAGLAEVKELEVLEKPLDSRRKKKGTTRRREKRRFSRTSTSGSYCGSCAEPSNSRTTGTAARSCRSRIWSAASLPRLRRSCLAGGL